MLKIWFSEKLLAKDHLRIFRSLFIFINIISILLYASIRVIFYNYDITLEEDLNIFLKTILVGSIASVAIYLAIVLAEFADFLSKQKRLSPVRLMRFAGLLLAMLLLFYFGF